jgi:serine/threonine protein kinase
MDFTDRFVLKGIIGQGNFGIVYKAKDKVTGNYVALKKPKSSLGIPEMQNEIKMIGKLQGGTGIPKLYFSSTKSNYYAMELLGPCVNDKFVTSKNYMSQSNFFIIAVQLLERLEFIHSRSIIHRDLKPHQLVLGGSRNKTIYIVDYGLSKTFESSSGAHIHYMDGLPFVGTFNYASVHAHLGIQQSRRDDLESYCYILAYFLTGGLPWKNYPCTQNESSIKRFKLSLKSHQLFPDKDNLMKIFTYVKSLKFDEVPQYSYIYSQLYEFKKGINDYSPILNWKSHRTLSLRRRRSKSTKKINIKSFNYGSALELNFDMSETQVDRNYPEFKSRPSKTAANTKRNN